LKRRGGGGGEFMGKEEGKTFRKKGGGLGVWREKVAEAQERSRKKKWVGGKKQRNRVCLLQEKGENGPKETSIDRKIYEGGDSLPKRKTRDPACHALSGGGGRCRVRYKT